MKSAAVRKGSEVRSVRARVRVRVRVRVREQVSVPGPPQRLPVGEDTGVATDMITYSAKAAWIRPRAS